MEVISISRGNAVGRQSTSYLFPDVILSVIHVEWKQIYCQKACNLMDSLRKTQLICKYTSFSTVIYLFQSLPMETMLLFIVYILYIKLNFTAHYSTQQ